MGLATRVGIDTVLVYTASMAK